MQGLPYLLLVGYSYVTGQLFYGYARALKLLPVRARFIHSAYIVAWPFVVLAALIDDLFKKGN